MNFLTKNIKSISIAAFIVVVLLVLFFSQYSGETERTFFCFDTLIDISLSGKNAQQAADEIEAVLLDMEKSYSKFRSDSVISEFNSLSEGESMSITEDMADLIMRSNEISKLTGAAFDITTSKLSDLWHIKTAAAPPSDSQIGAALNQTGYDKISLKDNILTKADVDIDFGGILKGMAADKARSIAEKHGIKSGLINLGGNVCLIGSKNGSPWTVGVTNPFSTSEIYLTVQAENSNIITSGAYQRYFEWDGKIYHHIISPETGYPAETDIASVTVISPDGTLADALSTAIFVQGSEKGFKTAGQLGVEVIIIKKDGSIIATDGVHFQSVTD